VVDTENSKKSDKFNLTRPTTYFILNCSSKQAITVRQVFKADKSLVDRTDIGLYNECTN